jgi:chemotaxis protein MotB
MAEAKKGDKKGEAAAAPAPIIIKKIQADEAAAHGGAWKIALADMMTAMMAFFLLMWLLGATSEAQRKSIADYFKPTPKSLSQTGQLAGSNGVLGGRSILDPEGLPVAASQTSLLDLEPPRVPDAGEQRGLGPESSDKEGKGSELDTSEGKGPDADSKQGKGAGERDLDDAAKAKAAAELDQKNFDQLEKELRQKLEENSALAALQGQVRFVRADDGLRIEIIDKSDFSMFGLGTTRLLPRAQALIDEIAKSIGAMPNKVAVRGHTDSVPFAGGGQRNNWSLSAERADVTRQILERSGVGPDRFARIEGVADTDHFNPADPYDPRNRRISVTLKFSGAEQKP